MPDSGSWDVVFDADSDQIVLGVDFPVTRRPEAGFAELAARIGPGYRFLQTKPPAARPGQRLCGDAYVGPWIEGIQHSRHRVRAVLGYGVGSVYAAAIATGISPGQQAPEVILFDPQFASKKLLGAEFHKEISAISPLLSDDEIERTRKAATEICGSAGDVANAAAELAGTYWEISSAAYERVGLGGACSRKFIASFESYISWLSVADQIDPSPAWQQSTTIVSSDYAELPDRESLVDGSIIGRMIPFDAGHADLLRSNSVASAVLDLLASRELVESSFRSVVRLPAVRGLAVTIHTCAGEKMSVLATAELLISGAERDWRDPLLRLEQLFDGNICEPLSAADDSEVQTAAGCINGARVIAYCTNATRMGGALGSVGSQRIIEAIETAVRYRCPVIGVWHSGGAKLADGVESMDAVGQMFVAMTRASGRIPQISVLVGPAAGAAAYGPALTDVIIMAPAGRAFITGPDVVKSVTGEQIDMEGLGGPEAHSRRSGVAHVTADSEADAYLRARRLVTFFTRPGLLDLSRSHDEQDLRALLPARSRRAYDVRPLVRAILDSDGDGEHGGGFDELQPRWAPNMVIGLGRLAGRTIGVVANNPIRKGGCLDCLSAEKAARFVRMCDSQGIPLLVIVDVPGYLPGVGEEWNGVVRRGAKLLYAFADAEVPRVTLVTRKSYGGAYIALNSRALGATAVFAWPDAEIAVMGAEAAVGILHRKRLAAVADHERDALKSHLVAEHVRIAGGVDRAMAIGVLDEVISPRRTRRRLAEAFAAASAGRGQHGNIPL